MVSKKREFRGNWRGEDRPFLLGTTEVTVTRVPRIRKERFGEGRVLRQR